jgi:integrase
LPYSKLPTFLIELRTREATAARALEFAIITAARTGEVIGARWKEIDLLDKTWTIPASRMKAGKEHRVPLTPRALAILDEMAKHRPAGDDGASYLFGGAKAGKPLSNMGMLMLLRRMGHGDELTVHGFRSTFRTWAAERTNFPREVIEAALAHTIGNKVEAAYQRGDMFEKRRRLMEAWAQFCATVPAQERQSTVTAIRAS